MMTLIKQGDVLLPGGMQRQDILTEGELIKEIAPEISESPLPRETRVLDASGCYVLPGIIDAHTHFGLNSRGTVTADGFAEGSRSAAYGGVTTVIDFADHMNDCTLRQCSMDRAEAMAGAMACDFALHQGVYRYHRKIQSELAALREFGVTAVKVFTTYKEAGYYLESGQLEKLFSACKRERILVTAHAEDDEVITEASKAFGDSDLPPHMHPLLRPAEAEYRAVKYLGSLAESSGIPLYIVHLSSARGLDALRACRLRGVRIAAETVPHYLVLTDQLLSGDDAPLYLMTPPLRGKEDTHALLEAVRGGEIQVIATDHCSFTREQKSVSHDCRKILPGIPGTELLLSIAYTLFSEPMGVHQTVRMMTELPARIFGIFPQKGLLAAGSDADIVLFDPRPVWTVTDASQHSAAGYTPYAGLEVTGRVRSVLRRGELLIHEGEYLGMPGTGRFVSAQTSSLWET